MPKGHGPHPWKETWSDEEVALLREAYASWPPRYDLLPHRPRGQIHTKAYRLGLTGRDAVGPQFAATTDTQWAYLAGIVDGEGTIGFYPEAVGGVRRVIAVANTDLTLIEWLEHAFPASCSRLVQNPVGEKGTPWRRVKPCYQLTWTAMHVIRELLEGMLPYLIIKREKAEILLADITAYQSRERDGKRGSDVARHP